MARETFLLLRTWQYLKSCFAVTQTQLLAWNEPPDLAEDDKTDTLHFSIGKFFTFLIN